MTPTGFVTSDICPLDDNHCLEGFSCGTEPIDLFIRGGLRKDHKRYKVRARVLCQESDGKAVGLYSLTVGALAPKALSGGILRKFGNWPIPTVYLAVIAVEASVQKQGVGERLMFDAFERVLDIALFAGVGCMTLDAIDDEKAKWYQKLGFEEFGRTDDGKPQMFISLSAIIDALA